MYVEATREETEARLLSGLRRQVSDLPTNLGQIESLTTLRQGRFIKPGHKVLLLLDQFEQWLHASGHEEHTEPDHGNKLTKEQNAFVDQAVSGLSRDNKVISVRLALFAEMVKGRPWTPAQSVTIGRIGIPVAVCGHINTENFHIFSLTEMHAIAVAAGLRDQCFWQDAAGRFNLHFLAPRTGAAEA